MSHRLVIEVWVVVVLVLLMMMCRIDDDRCVITWWLLLLLGSGYCCSHNSSSCWGRRFDVCCRRINDVAACRVDVVVARAIAVAPVTVPSFTVGGRSI